MNIKDIIFQIENISFKEALEYIVEKSLQKTTKSFVVTINPEIIMLAQANPDYEKVVKSADLALADGIGVIWAGKMFGRSFKGRTHGSDLVEKLSEAIAKKPITVGFLGGGENVAQRTAERLKSKYPSLNVVFAAEDWPGLELDQAKVSSIKNQVLSKKEKILNTPIDVLFVAFGSPKQEIWIRENLPEINVWVAIGVGGAFDFISGRVRRAPKILRSLGLEWLFRLVVQPWRAKRQIALVKFVFLVLKEKLL